MIIRPLTEKDCSSWDAFVHSHPEGTFFHLSTWRRVLERAFGHKTHFVLADRDGEIVGVLPLAEIKSLLFGHRLISLPFCVYGGALTREPTVFDSLIRHATELAQSLGVDDLELRQCTPGLNWPTNDLYATFRRQIDADPEVNLKNIPRKQRAMVRKGIKAGLNATRDIDVAAFYRIYSESVRNLGTPVFARRYFDVLADEFGADCQLLGVDDGQDQIAAVMSFRFRNEILPYYGGSKPRARQVMGNDFMYWALMSEAGEQGVEIFDFGRSKQGTGPYSFKKNWGFEPTPLSYANFLVRAKEVPQINPTNSKYQSLIALWRKLPLPIANSVGPFIARDLG